MLFFSESGLDLGEMLCIVDENITPFLIAMAWDYGDVYRWLGKRYKNPETDGKQPRDTEK